MEAYEAYKVGENLDNAQGNTEKPTESISVEKANTDIHQNTMQY